MEKMSEDSGPEEEIRTDDQERSATRRMVYALAAIAGVAVTAALEETVRRHFQSAKQEVLDNKAKGEQNE